MARLKAVLRVEEVGGRREVISTTVIAGNLEALKRKVVGIVELMDEADEAEIVTEEKGQ